jgi:acyl-CoA synthetase (NDP forming)
MSLIEAVASESRRNSVGRLLLDPASVALIGVSNDPGKASGRPLAFLRRSEFAGTVYPINPNRPQVQGERAWSAVSALPEVPEHAFVLTPTDFVADVVRECVEAGVGAVTVLADGFTENGPAGAARIRQLRQLMSGSATRLVGPSSLGVVNLRNGMVLTANAVFGEPDPLVGDILVVSQSGSMIGALVSRGKALGIGFASLVSVGSEIDLSVADIAAATLDDPGIRGYALFLESISDAPGLRRFAAAATAAGRPVVAYKLGRSSAGAELARSHTGALAGEEEVSAAFLSDCGIARVHTLDALIEATALAHRVRPTTLGRAPRVGVVTSTGGGAAMVVDQLGVRGIDVVQPTAETFARLTERGAPAHTARIVDLTLNGARYEVMRPALDTLTEAREHDVLVVVLGSSARLEPETAVRPIIEVAGRGLPVAVFLAPHAPEAAALLTAADVPVFRSPESCADAIAAIFSRRLRDLTPAGPAQHAGPGAAPVGPPAPAATDQAGDENTAYQVLDAIGVPRAATVVLDSDEVTGLPFDYPVAAKVLSAQIPHKTDVGGVVLDIKDADGLRAAMADIRASVARHRPDLAPPPILVEPMLTGQAEVLVGYRVDPQAGPIVLVAAGGELAEMFADRSLRLAPIDLATARDMISEVRSLRMLKGYRGRPPADSEALAQAMVNLSTLAYDPKVVELEINPLLVRGIGQGVIAVDALVRMHDTAHGATSEEGVSS